MKNNNYRHIGLALLAACAIPGFAQTSQTTPANLTTARPIVPGQPVTVSTDSGQTAPRTFQGSAGQHVSILLNDSTYANTCPRCLGLGVTIISPDGSKLRSTGLLPPRDTGSNLFMDAVQLPYSGNYTIMFTPEGGGAGSVKATLFLFNERRKPVTPDVPQTVQIKFPGENASLIFAGSAGQQVSLTLSNSTFGECQNCNSLTARIMPPSGAAVQWTKISGADTSAATVTATLPVDGDYTVIIDPPADRIGNVDVLLSVH